MSTYPGIVLKPGKEEPVKRFHPWIFSGAIAKTSGSIEEGDIVEVFSSKGDYLATGHAQSSSISVKIFSFQRKEINPAFWKEKLMAAIELRRMLGLTDRQDNNAYRLVYGEGDGLPGLVIDYLNGSMVIQCHSVGMHLAKEEIAVVLQELYTGKLNSIYDKSAESLSKNCNYDSVDSFLFGDNLPDIIIENGLSFQVDLRSGQKTGFFLDQRENRQILEHYAQGRTVLDLFCYSGGFSMHAIRAGAVMVHSVDSSKQAIALAEKNAVLNGFKGDRHRAIVADAKQYLDSTHEAYDLIILDPPAFARQHSMRQQAVKGYRAINHAAIQKIRKGGIIFTFSCSQAVDRSLFESTVLSAAIEAGREVKVLQRLSQPPDHPVNIFHPEGEYLKGMILMIE